MCCGLRLPGLVFPANAQRRYCKHGTPVLGYYKSVHISTRSSSSSSVSAAATPCAVHMCAQSFSMTVVVVVAMPSSQSRTVAQLQSRWLPEYTGGTRSSTANVHAYAASKWSISVHFCVCATIVMCVCLRSRVLCLFYRNLRRAEHRMSMEPYLHTYTHSLAAVAAPDGMRIDQNIRSTLM